MMKTSSLLWTFFLLANVAGANGLPLKTNSCEFAYIQGQFKQTYPVASAQSDSNFQQRIWQLRDQGMFDQAQALEDEMVAILKGPFSRPVDIKEGAGGGRYYPMPLRVVGVGKKAGRHWSTSVEAEVAAFRVDRLYGLDLAPVTVAREAENGIVSMQLFYKDAAQARTSKVAIPDDEWARLKIFDYLIDNFDRRDANLLVTAQGRLVAIDHGVTFHNARSTPYSPAAPRLEALDLSYFATPKGKQLLQNLRDVPDARVVEELSGLLPLPQILKFIERKNRLLSKLGIVR